jgi:hypothetical protein
VILLFLPPPEHQQLSYLFNVDLINFINSSSATILAQLDKDSDISDDPLSQ